MHGHDHVICAWCRRRLAEEHMEMSWPVIPEGVVMARRWHGTEEGAPGVVELLPVLREKRKARTVGRDGE